MNLLAWHARKRELLDAWGDARRILLVRLDSLGDVILTTPAIHAIRESQPAARLTLLASSVGAQAGRLDPDLDDVIVYDSPMSDAWLELPQAPERELELVAALRQGEYDGAIIFTSYHQSPLPAAMLCYLAGIPLRLGATDDGAGSLLTTRHHWPPGLYHEVERALPAASTPSACSSWCTPAARCQPVPTPGSGSPPWLTCSSSVSAPR